ncbi:hypothetical protein HanRHA438_Chr12g0537151 [Helianthus annuus]|nr:hypothetical protein HanRHA438_Chr12g0537151 [Helianthus annuus]
MGGIFFSSITRARSLFFSSIKNPNSPFPSITAPFPFTRSLQVFHLRLIDDGDVRVQL